MSFNSPVEMTTFTSFNLDQEIKLKSQHLVIFDQSKQIANNYPRLPLKKGRKPGYRPKPKPSKPLPPGRLSGHWNCDQKKKYHWFLEFHHQHFERKHLRRMDKIFKTMADFVGSRAADQCRSHHQKMEKKYKTFYNIIYNLRMENYQVLEVEEMRHEMNGAGIKGDFSLINPGSLMEEEEEDKEQRMEVQIKIEMGENEEQQKFQKEGYKVIGEDDGAEYQNHSYNIMEESLDPLII